MYNDKNLHRDPILRYLLIPITAILFLSACSGTTTAFDFFKMDLRHEQAITNLRTGTIVRSFETEAIISSIYLNNAIPSDYNTTESFYMSLYLKDYKRVYFKENSTHEGGYIVRLNGKAPIYARELERDDKLRSLMPIQNEWNKYYLVEFEKTDATILKLELENDQSDVVELIYQKDVQ